MTSAESRITELGIVLPPPFSPVASYLSCARTGDLLFVGGHGPTDADRTIVGKVGTDLTIEQGREAARMTALSILATMRAELGTLDRVEQIVKVFGMVNVGGSFDRTPAVIDGCSDLLIEVFGDKGRHTRSAVGMAALPFQIAVEIELIARVS
jgi:enamine deaminase RidA (YjgF/YER057c/UK114 family)